MVLFLLAESYLSVDLEEVVLDIQLQAAPIFINNLINQKAHNINKAETAKVKVCTSCFAEDVVCYS
jgi:hypothetical protein